MNYLGAFEMRKTAFAAIAAVAITFPGGASAADLAAKPMYTKAPAPMTYAWTGSYIGVYAGGAFGAKDAVTGVPVTVGGLPLFAGPAATYGLKSSFIGGITDGYNLQFAPNWVIGYESETGYISLKGSSAFAGRPTSTAFTNIESTYSVWSGRLGYAWDRSLIYAKGGLALAQLETGVTDPTPGIHTDTSGHRYRFGYAVGGGWEYMLDPKWSIKAEYLYLGLDRSYTTTGNTLAGPTQVFTTTNIPGIHTAKIGLNYKWDWMALLR